MGRVKKRSVFWAGADPGVLVPTHADDEAIGMDEAPERYRLGGEVGPGVRHPPPEQCG